MIKILKEEYDKRINQYLDEVETKAKHNETDGELVFLAGGLKVKNRAGFTFTINNIKQLKPKAGGGRTISVNAGRFVSRVNDAFDISKLKTSVVDPCHSKTVENFQLHQ